MNKSLIAKYAGVISAVAVFIFGLIWGGTISSIEVNGDFTAEPQLKVSAEKCLSQFMGRSFWLLSDKTIHNSVLTCESMFDSSVIRHSFPRKLIVDIAQVQSVVKIEKADKSCILIHNSSSRVTLPAERCISYPLPLLIGTNIEDNVFVQDYAVNLIAALKKIDITIKTITLSGDKIAPWYDVTLDNKVRVLLPSVSNITDKVAVLKASINGLNTAKERYSTIDLRFDMVTYK